MTRRAVAVVTGGTRGVGAAIAHALSEDGHTVVPVGRSAARFATDVGDPDSVAQLRAAVEAEVGPPGILVNAAGMFGPISLIVDSEPNEWVTTVMVDLVGAYLTCRAFVPAMIEMGWGRVVNVSSAASLHPPGVLNSAYGTSKAGLNQFTRHLAAELDGTGVTANVIHPGDLKTAMWGDIRDQVDRLGDVAADYAHWVDWVEQTGGDPVDKAAELVLRIVASDVSGQFLWIEDPLQPAVASWNEDDAKPPWSR
jgi:NAD(P)-dependent dehydrogenase (short-subunit alcohol dehydrogenase family)